MNPHNTCNLFLIFINLNILNIDIVILIDTYLPIIINNNNNNNKFIYIAPFTEASRRLQNIDFPITITLSFSHQDQKKEKN